MDISIVFLCAHFLFIMLSTIAFVMALFAWVEVKAMQRSTHSIQYMPASTEFEQVTKDLEEKLSKDIFEAV